MRDVAEDQRRWSILAWILAGVGAAIYASQVAWNRSWWGDEARIVVNIVTRPAERLIGPLDLQQAAPPVFLWIERAAYVAFGSGEWGLRLFPLLCGVAAMVLVTAIAVHGVGAGEAPARPVHFRGREIVPEPWHANGPGAALAAGVMAFSAALAWHAAEAKPYSGDVLAAAILWAIALWPREAGAMRPARWWAWCATAAALLWLSYPAVLVITGIGGVELLWRLGRDPSRVRRLAHWAAGIALPVASFAAVYFLAIRPQQQSGLYEYWDDRFADWSRPWTVPFWALRGTNSVFNYPIRNTGLVFLVLGVVAAVALWQTGRRRVVMLLTAPLLVTLLAGAAGQYPFSGRRLTVFLTPGAVLLTALGLNASLAFFRERWPEWRGPRVALLALAGVMVGMGAWEMIPASFDPPHRGQVRPVFEALAQRHEQGEPIVLIGENVPLELYALTAGVRDRLTPLLNVRLDELEAAPHMAEELIAAGRAAAGRGGRFWIAFEYTDEETLEMYLAAISAAAPRAAPVVTFDGGRLYLVEGEQASFAH